MPVPFNSDALSLFGEMLKGNGPEQLAGMLVPKLFFSPVYAEMKSVEALVKASKVDWTFILIINSNVKTNSNGYATSLGDSIAKFNVIT